MAEVLIRGKPKYKGTTLTYLLQRLHKTQEELARAAGLSHPAISRIARGEREPDPSTRAKLIAALRKWNRAIKEEEVFLYTVQTAQVDRLRELIDHTAAMDEAAQKERET